jgi:hypothetical protein
VAITFDRDPPSYSYGDSVYITITVNYTVGGAPANGTDVRVELVTANGNLLVGNASTGTDNIVTFRYNASRRDGGGTYTTTADGVNGTDIGSGGPTTFTVN